MLCKGCSDCGPNHVSEVKRSKEASAAAGVQLLVRWWTRVPHKDSVNEVLPANELVPAHPTDTFKSTSLQLCLKHENTTACSQDLPGHSHKHNQKGCINAIVQTALCSTVSSAQYMKHSKVTAKTLYQFVRHIGIANKTHMPPGLVCTVHNLAVLQPSGPRMWELRLYHNAFDDWVATDMLCHVQQPCVVDLMLTWKSCITNMPPPDKQPA